MSISQDIENKINIVDLASKYLPLKKAWVNYKCLCPFHNEKSPSFVVSPTKNIAYCFSCHKGGGPIRFLMEIEKLEYREAIHVLAKEAGIELKTDYYKERGENRTDIYEMYKITADFYHQSLFAAENTDKLEYVRDGRGLTLDTIKKFQIGFSGNPRELFAKLRDRGFTEKDIIDSGIFVGPGRDKFYGRIIFPIANFAGNTVAFTGRIIGAGEPKYLNSPASNIFDKSSILYGLHLAKNEIAKRGYVLIVEGQMDTVALHQAGIINAVGISGTALTKEHLSYLKRLTKKIYLCLDSDAPGVKATFASLESLSNEDFDVRIVHLPNGKDPDEFVKSGGDFEKVLENALSVPGFYMKEAATKYDLSWVVGKTALVKDLMKVLKRLNNRIEVDTWIREIARTLDLSLETVYAEYRGLKEKRVEEAPTKSRGFELGEVIAAYISLYGFKDLFLEKFMYNSEHSRVIPSFSVVEKILGIANDASEYDEDRLKAIELHIEEGNAESTEESIRMKFLELVHTAAKTAFEAEKSGLATRFDPNSREYLEAYQSLLEKGKKLGLKTNRA